MFTGNFGCNFGFWSVPVRSNRPSIGLRPATVCGFQCFTRSLP